jgi:hypothetical protein
MKRVNTFQNCDSPTRVYRAEFETNGMNERNDWLKNYRGSLSFVPFLEKQERNNYLLGQSKEVMLKYFCGKNLQRSIKEDSKSH